MPRISESTLVGAVNGIVKPILKKGELHTITHKAVRQKVEEKLGLETGTTDDPEYKRVVRDATLKLIDEASDNEEGEDDAEQEPPKPKKPAKKPTSASSSKRKRSPSPIAEATPSPPRKAARSKRSKPADDDDEASKDEYQEDDSEAEASRKPKKGKAKAAVKAKPQPKRRKSKPKAASDDEAGEPIVVDEEPKGRGKAPPKAKVPKPKNGALYKTPEHVPTSDVEQDEPEAAPSPKKRSPAKPKPKKSPPKKAAPGKSAAVVASEAEDDDTEAENSKAKGEAPSPKKQPPVKPTDNGDDSETGLSDLIDEPPKKKRQPKSKDGKAASKAKESSTKRRASASKPVLSKDEEQIKKLKSLILACGVRKVWAKLFKGLDSRQQIAKLKEILNDLGMTGRLSLEKAKEIKAKREFQQELEDVKEFAKSMEQRGTRQKAVEGGESEEEQAQQSDEEEEDVVPRRRSGNARNSIAAFLQDQSDSD